MVKKRDSILSEVLDEIKIPNEEMKEIDLSVKEFLKRVKTKISSMKIKAEIFVGGSFAKKTMIRKGQNEVDIFIRFDRKHREEDLSDLTKKIIDSLGFKDVITIHGSRDYFKVKISERLFFEIVPVRKIINSKEAENITDLSYSHARYIQQKVKSEKILDEIKIAKAFCHANGCYGAESYIKGFSGYSLELLVYHYKGFMSFVRALAKIKSGKKEVVDPGKHYKNKNRVLMDLNESKIHSPIILIDPTLKTRNVLAALSDETFVKFRKVCSDFIKKPDMEAFREKKKDLVLIKERAKKKGFDFVLIETATDKQEGDIAGSKLLKFYNHLGEEIRRFFEIKDGGFEYSGGKSAKYFFAGHAKKELLISGPHTDDAKNVKRFRAKHKTAFIKGGKIYAREKVKFNLKKFVEEWKKRNKNKIREMSVSGFSLVK